MEVFGWYVGNKPQILVEQYNTITNKRNTLFSSIVLYFIKNSLLNLISIFRHNTKVTSSLHDMVDQLEKILR